MEKFLYIDVDNFIMRYLHTNKDNDSALIMMINAMKGLVSDFEPTYVICAYDSGKSKYRKSIYPEYKSNREKSELSEEDKAFLNRKRSVKEDFLKVLTYLGCICVGSYGIEADDLISVGIRFLFTKGQSVIVSADKDYFQLVSRTTEVYSPSKKILYDRDKLCEELEITDQKLSRVVSIMSKVLIGDDFVSVLKKFKITNLLNCWKSLRA